MKTKPDSNAEKPLEVAVNEAHTKYLAEMAGKYGTTPDVIAKAQAAFHGGAGSELLPPSCDMADAFRVFAAIENDKARPMGDFSCVLRSAGNPDMREFFGEGVLSPTQTIHGESPEALAKLATAYRDKHELGGGNWPTCLIKDKEGRAVGKIAYNGRIFPVEAAKQAAENAAPLPCPPHAAKSNAQKR
jgi:hypothetical protein